MQLPEYRNHLLSARRSAGTVRQRVRHITVLLREYPDLAAVTRADLEANLAGMTERGLAAETVKSARASYRSYFAWAYRTGLIPENPAADLEAIRIPVRVPRVARDDAVLAALERAPLQVKAMILLARLACLRLTELASLKISQRDGDVLRIIGKGDKERLVYDNDDLRAVLDELERDRGGVGYYFPGRFGGYMHPQSVNKLMTRTTGTNPHSLRHAGATAAYNATHDLRSVQSMLGHSSMATTQRYLHVDELGLRRAANATRLLAA